MLPNRASGPQNHPSAKVAVSILCGDMASMGGMAEMVLVCEIFMFALSGAVSS
jgi:hypothetical protein